MFLTAYFCANIMLPVLLQVQAAKDFWVHLPRAICNGDIAAQPGEDEDCWNGQDRAR